MAGFAGLSSILFGGSLPVSLTDLVAASWFVSGAAAIAFAAFAFLPPRFWVRVGGSAGNLWAYAVVVVIAAISVGNASRSLWESAAYLTFNLSEAFLSPFISGVISDPATMHLGTQKFSVIINPQCSGLEGAGLMLAFGVIWLCLFRKECRFPQALALLPAGVVLIFLLNAVRIAALILIGDAGAQQIALGGFHSQAGWIAFNVVALGFAVAARRVSWWTKIAPEREIKSATNSTAVYLLPFLMILASGMISRAVTADFEWLYSLRFFAAVAILWVFQREYVKLDWRFGWVGPGIGALVFFLWIALDHLLNTHTSSAMPSELASATTTAQVTWVTFRTFAAVLAVPIAEELAFRGFLLRRLISSNFESISPGRFTWFALLASSLAFGILHGDLWFAGTLAGILYGIAVIRRGRIGEAVVAHATTNALLVAYILAFHKWHLW